MTRIMNVVPCLDNLAEKDNSRGRGEREHLVYSRHRIPNFTYLVYISNSFTNSPLKTEACKNTSIKMRAKLHPPSTTPLSLSLSGAYEYDIPT